jgi:hypothetical protein
MVALYWRVCPATMEEVAGLIVTTGAGESVITADPVFVRSAWLVAVIVTCCGAEMVPGAV